MADKGRQGNAEDVTDDASSIAGNLAPEGDLGSLNGKEGAGGVDRIGQQPTTCESHAIVIEDVLSMRAKTNSMSNMTTDSDTRSSSCSGPKSGRTRTPPPLVVPVSVQNQEHYQQLLEQGKLRHGSIIKKSNRRGVGSNGSHVVVGMDGTQKRLPRSGSQASLGPSESSVETSNQEASAASNGSRKGYRLRERDAFDELWVIIVNGQKKKAWEERCARLLNQLSLVKWKVYLTRYKEHARKLAYRAANKGADMIIAVGGDGTLEEVVDGMMRSHVKDEMGLPRAVLTVLPLGSANDFHKSLGWNDDFEESMWRIGKRGETALMDVGKVSCAGPDGEPIVRYWMNISSVGVSARIAGTIEPLKILGSMKYNVAGFLGGLKSLLSRSDVLVSYDGGEWSHLSKFHVIAACNGGTFGDGLRVSSKATPFDGSLDIVVGRKGGVLGLINLMSSMARGIPSKSKYLSSKQCRRIDLVPATRKGKPLDIEKVDHGSAQKQEDTLSREESLAETEESLSYSEDPRLKGNTGEQEEVTSGSTQKTQHRPRKLSPSTLKVMKQEIKEQQKKLLKSKYPLECDGEMFGQLPATFEILPRAIKFRVPRTET